MNKNTKMIVGVGAVAIVGYLVWKNMSKPKPAFANLTSSKLAVAMAPGCPCGAAAPDQSGVPAGWVLCAGKNAAGEYDKMCKQKAVTTTGAFAGREF